MENLVEIADRRLPLQPTSMRWLIPAALLPILMIAPEVIDIGFMFLRWDYVMLAGLSVILAARIALSPNDGIWNISINGVLFIGLLIFLSAYQVAMVKGSDGLLAGVKYAFWPIKVTVWALLAREFFRDPAANPLPKYLVRFVLVLVVLVLAMQLLELVSPAFRSVIFYFYPVDAESRLMELTFRARGPFSGYDVTSLFFVVAIVVFNESKKTSWGLTSTLNYAAVAASLVGAFISARTGFVLALLYLGISAWRRASAAGRVVLVGCVGIGIIGITTLGELSGSDESLIGRYAELLSALSAGDLTQVQSVYGTFYMNAVIFGESWNPMWGAGLDAGTTADQLYAKYLFMFGIVGLSIWIFIHFSTILLLRKARGSTVDEQVYFAKCALVVALLFALAHIKGGNYFFSSRLGDIVVLLIVLSFSTPGRVAKFWDFPASRRHE